MIQIKPSDTLHQNINPEKEVLLTAAGQLKRSFKKKVIQVHSDTPYSYMQ